MSWLSRGIKKVGHWAGDRVGNGPSMSGLKSSIKGTGKLTSKAADYVGMIPGVGQVVAPIMKTAGEVAAGTNVRDAAVKGALTFAGGKLGSAVGSKLGAVAGKIPGVSSVTNALQGGPVGDLSGASRVGDMVNHLDVSKLGTPGGGGNMGFGSSLLNAGKTLVKDKVKGAVLGEDGRFGLDDIGRGIKKVGSFALDNPDLLLAAGSAYEGINANNDANKFRDRALAMAEADAASRGQFRDMAMSRLGATQRPDLGSIFGGSGNPYASAGSIPRVGSGAPVAPMPSAPSEAPPMVPPGGRPLLARVGQRVNAKRQGGM